MKVFHAICSLVLTIFSASFEVHAQEWIGVESVNMEEYQNGIYRGYSQANDLLTRFQEAFARAVGHYVEDTQEFVSSSTINGNMSSATTAANKSGTFGAKVLEYKDYDNPTRAEILVKIDPHGKGYRYKYSSYMETTEDSMGNSSTMWHATTAIVDEANQIKMYYECTIEERLSDNGKTPTTFREVRDIHFTSNSKTY
jgi:hypothetical protein